MSGSSRVRLRVSVDLPAPDGDDRIRRSPRRVSSATALLHVLDLLAELLDHGLEVEPEAREGDVVRLGAERVGLAPELLGEEVEPAPDCAAGCEKLARRRDMGDEPVE